MTSKSLVFLIALAGLVLGWSLSCRADTDYQCLGQCVNSGKPSSVCMNDCSYGVKQGQTVGTSSTLPNHHVLETPQPAGDTIILPPTATQPPPVSVDWTCMKACLQPPTPYAACEEQCAKGSVKPKQPAKMGGAIP